MTEVRAPWRPRAVTMRTLAGEQATALYYVHEVAEMERDRAAGLPDDEIRFIHELKATFDATLWKHAPEKAGMVPEWDERRNTSGVRIVARAEDYLATLEPPQDDRQAEADAEAALAQQSLL